MLTLECFYSSLQSCTYVIWARVALKLSVFGQIWGQLGTKLSVWMKRPCTIPIPGFINLAHEPIWTLECFRSIFQPFAHVIWAKSVLELLVFALNWGSACQKMFWSALSSYVDIYVAIFIFFQTKINTGPAQLVTTLLHNFPTRGSIWPYSPPLFHWGGGK